MALEDYVLILIPAACLLLVAPLRLRTIWSRSIKVFTPTILQLVKALSAFIFVGFSLGMLIATCTRTTSARAAEIPAAVVAFLASVISFGLSYLEHVRSIRPSKLLQLYLMVALIVQSVHLRTTWTRQDDIVLEALGIGQVVSCAAFLAVESMGKQRILIANQQRSPQDVNGIISERLFWWLNSLFSRGYRTLLAPGDLYDIDEDLSSSENHRHFRLVWLKHYHHNPEVSMVRIVVSAMRYDILLPIAPKLLLIAVNFAQPYLILRFVEYLEHPSEGGTEEGILLVLATALVYTLIGTFQSWYLQSVVRFQVKLRGYLTTALHDKALRSRPDSNSSPLTLMNVDIERILLGLKSMHEYWSTTLTIAVALFLLYRQVGVVFLAPFLLLATMVAISVLNGSKVGPKLKVWFSATQDRVSYVTDVIAAMKNVKLLGIGPSVLQRGNDLRNSEVAAQRSIRLAILLNVAMSLMLFQASTLVMYGAYAIRTHYGGVPLTNTRLFSSMSILKLVTSPLLGTIQSIPGFLQSISSLERIQNYLVIEDHADDRHINIDIDKDDVYSAKGGFGALTDECIARLKDVSSGYSSDTRILSDVSCDFRSGKLSMVLGPVGSGKSILLKTLLGEAKVMEGVVSVNIEDAAFCDQTAWLWNASVKENICANLEFDESWFNRITWACGLHDDFQQLSRGTSTPVGGDGSALSGGQKNRIALARALYSRKRLFVLDDVLSGLDTHTEKLVFMRVFGPNGILKQMRCTVILATHAIAWIKYADTAIIIEKGRIAYQGSPSNAPAPYSITAEVLNLANSPVGKMQLEELPKIEHELEESSPPSEEASRHSDMRVYKQYLNSFGPVATGVYFALSIAYEGATAVQSLWLTWWAGAAPTSDSGLGKYAGTFTGITLVNVGVIVLFIYFSFMVLLPRSERYLHAKQWDALVKVAYSAWGLKDTGSVVNRFSQDISIIDTQLNINFINSTTLAFSGIASAAILAVAVPFIAATFPFLLAIFWAIQKVYLRTSKQLRIMDLEAKAPLCTHFLETVSGVVTIDAFGWSESYRQRNWYLLIKSQVPFYLLASIQNWLSLVLNLVVAGLATVVIAIAVKLRQDADAGYVGLALVQVMDLGTLIEHLVIGWTGLETSLGAVARLNEFIDDTPPEEQGSVIPNPDWLSRGEIEITNLIASYSETAEPTIKNVNLHIQSGKHIAICGRTGSGKSSLASALFGLLHIRNGTIKLDNVDIQKVSQDLLRSKLVALPQDPFFSPGTVRDNLSLTTLSLHSVSDAAMLGAMEKVGLLDKFESLAARSGETWLSALDVELTPADMLTKGQMQLFAMARAMLSPGQIVLVDEATSGLDHTSEALVQKLLRQEFAGRTIVAIAHHLKTILDFDTVIVMDNGRVAEMGSPEELKDKEGSLFGELIRAME